jgi:hypothetical protein
MMRNPEEAGRIQENFGGKQSSFDKLVPVQQYSPLTEISMTILNRDDVTYLYDYFLD